MPICNRVASAAFLALLPCAALALDGSEAPAAPTRGLMFKSPQAAARQGFESYRSGDVASSLEALRYAAEKGHPLAQWKLGRMYADGDGVPADDSRALDYFTKIVESYDEDGPERRDLSIVSNAFVAVGVYSLNGVGKGRVQPDFERAREMFQFAATNFGNADAQYNLARMFLDGTGMPRNAGQATRWLSLAADKNHRQAQGLLGHLLFAGQGGIPRQRARGLMWLTLAREAAEPAKDAWIVEAYSQAMSAATDPDRNAARVYLEAHLRKKD